MPLRDNERISRKVLIDNIPGFVIARRCSANSESLSLANGVIHEPAVFSQFDAIDSIYISRLSRDEALQEVLEFTLANETDAGTIFFIKNIEILITSNRSDFGFIEAAYREKRMRNLALIQSIEEIGLIFAIVEAAQKLAMRSSLT